jgi:hypothetical protein
MSRNKSSDEKVDMKEICVALCRIDSPNEMRDFLAEILTPAEQRDLALRWELMRPATSDCQGTGHQFMQDNTRRENPETGSFHQ